MRALLAPLSELGEYEEIRELLARGKTSAALSGCADSQKLHMIYGLGEGFRRKLIITFNDLRAKELYERADQGFPKNGGRCAAYCRYHL